MSAQTAVCVFEFAPYETKELALKVGQKVFILQKHQTGWWKGSLEDNPQKIGWFPSQFVREITSSSTSSTSCSVFATPLSQQLAYSKTTLPLVPIQLMEIIDTLGTSELGVFRVPASKADMDSWKHRLDTDEQTASPQLASEINDVNLAAGLLKMYFSQLPDPIFTPFDRWASLAGMGEQEVVKQGTEWFQPLTPALLLVRTLFDFLHASVVPHAATSRMDPPNLAMVFAPHLMRREAGEGNPMLDIQVAVKAMQQLLTYWPAISSALPPAPPLRLERPCLWRGTAGRDLHASKPGILALTRGDSLLVLRQEDQWLLCQCGERIGWVGRDFVKRWMCVV
eukprot:gnl/Dysnectes_brevis/2514_a3010_758.p1 GENE.gnl/Dysnectes_brevis/2514_a3010_758~~gnl/Dysnectes_brevis/2514_a3010_758.p1  ORF type:complete len:339 (-),score=82.15 gnl/Dysnectes_brevis/2514_a3010_758:67-1083(-)